MPTPATPTDAKSQTDDRAGTAQQARSAYGKAAKYVQTQFAESWLQLQGQYDRNPPFDPHEMAASGKGELANFNTGEFRAQILSDVRPHFTLATGSQRPARWRTTYGQPWQRPRWMRDWSFCYAELLKQWDGYTYRTLLMLKDRAKFGTGPTYFPDHLSYQDKSIPPWALLLPEKASADPEQWDFFFIVDTLRVHQLVRILGNYESTEGRAYRIDKWQPENIRAAIKKMQSGDGLDASQFNQGGDDLVSYDMEQQDMMEKLLATSYSRYDRVNVVRWYIKGLKTGKWSEYLFTVAGEEGYLYKDVEAHDSVFDIISPNPYDAEHHYHSIKGLGSLISGSTEHRDILMNRGADSVLIGSSLVLQGAMEGDMQKLGDIEWGFPVIGLPPQLDYVRTDMQARIDGIGSLLDRMGALNATQTAHTMARPLNREQEKTLGQVQMEMGERMELEEHEVVFFQKFEERSHAARMKRIQRMIGELMLNGDGQFELQYVENADDIALKETLCPGYRILAKIIFEAVGTKRIPIEAILGIDPRSCEVIFPATIRQMLLTQGAAQSLGPTEVANWNRNFLVSVMGPGRAAEISPTIATELETGQDPTEARTVTQSMREHGTFADGYTIIPDPQEDHLTAALTHLQHAQQIIQPYMAQESAESAVADFAAQASGDANPAQMLSELPSAMTGVLSLQDKLDLLGELTALWTHNMAQPGQDGGGFLGHVRYVEQAPALQEQAAALLAQWGPLFGILQKLEAEIGEQGEAKRREIIARAQTPQMSPAEQQKVITEQLKQQIALQKGQAEVEVMAMKAQAETAIKLQQFQLEARLKTALTNMKTNTTRNA